MCPVYVHFCRSPVKWQPTWTYDSVSGTFGPFAVVKYDDGLNFCSSYQTADPGLRNKPLSRGYTVGNPRLYDRMVTGHTTLQCFNNIPAELCDHVLSYLLTVSSADRSPQVVERLVSGYAELRPVCKATAVKIACIEASAAAWYRFYFDAGRKVRSGRKRAGTEKGINGRLLCHSLPHIRRVTDSVASEVATKLLRVLQNQAALEGALPGVSDFVVHMFRRSEGLRMQALALAKACVLSPPPVAREMLGTLLVPHLVPLLIDNLDMSEQERSDYLSPDVNDLASCHAADFVRASVRRRAANVLSTMSAVWSVLPDALPRLVSTFRDQGCSVWDKDTALLAVTCIARVSGRHLLTDYTLLDQLISPLVHDEQPIVRGAAYSALSSVAQGVYAYSPALLTDARLQELLTLFAHALYHDPHAKASYAAGTALADLVNVLHPPVLRSLHATVLLPLVAYLPCRPRLAGAYDVIAEFARHDALDATLQQSLVTQLQAIWRAMDRTELAQCYVLETIIALVARSDSWPPSDEEAASLLALCGETVGANLPLVNRLQERILDAVFGLLVACEENMATGQVLVLAPWLPEALVPIAQVPHVECNLTVSVFALLGEALRQRPAGFLSAVHQWMPQALNLLESPWEAATRTNNAAWTCGIAATRSPSPALLEPYAAAIAQRLVPVLLQVGREEAALEAGGPGHLNGEDGYLRITAACALGAVVVCCTDSVAGPLHACLEAEGAEGWWAWADLLVRGPLEVTSVEFSSEEQTYAVLGFVLMVGRDVACLLRRREGGEERPAWGARERHRPLYFFETYLRAVGTVLDGRGFAPEEAQSTRAAHERTLVVIRDTLTRLQSHLRSQRTETKTWTALLDGVDRTLLADISLKLELR